MTANAGGNSGQWVVLPDPLADYAQRLGLARSERAEANGWTKNVHTKTPRRERDVQAAGAEAAVSVLTGGKWVTDMNAFRSLPDVMPDLEVRHIAKAHWRLPVYRDDDPARRFVLVYGTLPRYRVIGWILGAEAQIVGTWEDQHNTGVGAWFVHQHDLRPVALLIEEKVSG